MIRGSIRVPLEPLNGLLGTDCKYSEKKVHFDFIVYQGLMELLKKRVLTRGDGFP
jgi:hypothetical protein